MEIRMIGQKGLPVSADSGGIERHVDELATRLAAMGHRVTCYVRPRYVDARITEYKGVKLQRAPSIPTKSLDTLTHTFFATLSALVRPADIIHYHGVGPATLAWIPRLFKPKAKIVVTIHSLDRQNAKWGFFARLYLRFGEWAATRFPHATIAVSRSIRRYCREAFGDDVEYVPNGAKLKPHPGSDLLSRWGLTPGSYILTVARLVRPKGIHHLVQAYDGFEQQKKLVIVGAGDAHSGYAEELRKLSEGNSAIVFTGFQDGRALEQLYANAYLYVHPSEAEGLSVSILEAMAAGRTVLVSDIPENVESIDHSGLTFVNADADDLRAKLRELLNHPEIVAERGNRARDWIRQEYDWDVIAKKTAGLYGRLIDTR
ncbi:MAG TPA: glycosyltransferase family 4 protein [Candidatus Baltobacteraceae bacterium]|nr:glycosyltransferase family 4 protein [Candidatus Baltobacteraceae bacterium]